MKTLNLKSLLALLAFISFWGCNDNYPKSKKESSENSADSIAYSLIDSGSIYDDRGDYAEASVNYLKSLAIFEKMPGHEDDVAHTYNLIGILYARQGNHKKAMDYFTKDLNIREKIIAKNPSDTACLLGKTKALNNIGLLFELQNRYQRALPYYQNALVIAEKIGDKKNISLYCNNIGSTYRVLGNYRLAINYLNKALKVKEEISDKNGEARVLMNLGITYSDQNDPRNAFTNLDKALQISKEVGDKNLEKEIYAKQAEAYASENDFAKAYEYHQYYSNLNDSLMSEENAQKVADADSKFQTEKKEHEIVVLNKDKEVQRAIIRSVIAFALILVIVSIIIFRMLRISRRKSIIIDLQKKEVEKQKGLVDVKNKEMTDSINYASRIQRAMLPKIADIQSALPESFIFYQPKDIVSGDFYWFQKVGDAVFIAAADCTGHGVPGALTSAFCNSALNDAIAITQNPAEMLSFVNNFVKSALKQTDGETKDGMDIALVKITGKTLEYSAANRPIYIVRSGKNEVEETRADKTAIGGFTEDNYRFKLHTFSDLKDGDRFYLASDGFADQFGGPKGKKVTTKHFKEMLVSSKDLPMAQQKKMLENFMRDWMPDSHEQVDDFLVIGVEM